MLGWGPRHRKEEHHGWDRGWGRSEEGAVRALRLETQTCKAQGGQMRLGRHVGKGQVVQTTEATLENGNCVPEWVARRREGSPGKSSCMPPPLPCA